MTASKINIKEVILMKTMRLPLLISLSITIVGVILGSFFDLNISKTIADTSNIFGITVSTIGPTIGFAFLAMMGGGFIAFALKGKYHLFLKIFFYIMATLCLGASIYFSGKEYFEINGFNMPEITWVGYLIVLLPECGALVGGYYLFKDCENNNMWIILCIVCAVILLTLVGGVTLLKNIMHRPRYRLISNPDLTISFHNWWEPLKEYKDLISQYNLSKDDFKSFPSGHASEASIPLVIITFLPLANRKYSKYQLPIYIVSFAFLLLIMFVRILVGAHFLSDVSMGAALMILFTFIANEIVIKCKSLQVEIN